jgi:3-oxoacyl-[acyl-carrier protein] reductase
MDASRAEAPGPALITGASRGIGAAIAFALAQAGHQVVVNYREDSASADAVVRRISGMGGSAVAVQGDVSDPAAVDTVFDQAEKRFGTLSVLVNNAGKRADQVFSVMAADEWTQVMSVNLDAVFYTTQRALPKMTAARYGRVVNIGSVLGQRSLPGTANYAASKAALEGLTRSLAVEVARRGITVNLVSPGLVDTDLVREVEHLHRAARTVIPARRAAAPSEIAACVRFLCSAEASYVTGANLTVDGGLSAQAYPMTRG